MNKKLIKDKSVCMKQLQKVTEIVHYLFTNALTPVPAVTTHVKTHPQFPVPSVTTRKKHMGAIAFRNLHEDPLVLLLFYCS